MGRALKVACILQLVCWSNNVVNSHLFPGPFNRRKLGSCRAPQCSYRLINNALRIVTECLRPAPADNLSIPAGIQHAEVRRNGAALSHGAWTSAPLSARSSIECKRTASQIETTICTRRTTSHQFIFLLRRRQDFDKQTLIRFYWRSTRRCLFHSMP